MLILKNEDLTKLFTEAGEAVHRQWEQADFALEAFPTIAEAALQDSCPIVHVTPEDVYRWTLTNSELPKQHDIKASFAQPPVTVYVNDRFHIAFLFWTTSTTAIHQHSFEGAFRVFRGSSIEATYTFTEEERWGDHLLRGQMEMQSLELLPTGKTRSIAFGPSYIHSAYHLDYPSITLIIRTHNRSRQPSPQYVYLSPGLAVNPFEQPEPLERIKQLLSYLHEIEAPDFVAHIKEALDANDAFGAYVILKHLRDSLTPADLASIIQRLGERFGPGFSETLPLAFREMDRTNSLIHARQTMTDPEGRFFLALLLNTSDRDHFRSLLSERFPHTKPEEVTTRWVTELLKLKSLGIEASSFSGMLVRGMLSGLSKDEILRKLAPLLRTEDDANKFKAHAEDLVFLFRPAFDSAALENPANSA